MDFIINVVDKMIPKMDDATKKLLDAQKISNCGFKSIQNGIMCVMSPEYRLYNLTAPAIAFNKTLTRCIINYVMGTSLKQFFKDIQKKFFPKEAGEISYDKKIDLVLSYVQPLDSVKGKII